MPLQYERKLAQIIFKDSVLEGNPTLRLIGPTHIRVNQHLVNIKLLIYGPFIATLSIC